MARPRKDLSTKLKSILKELHVPADHLYFQPTSNIEMHYPCVIYQFARPDEMYANNKHYIDTIQYDITVIDWNPDSPIPRAIQGSFPYCTIDRYYTTDNLNHTALTLYF